MPNVHDFFDRYEGVQRDVLLYLHELISAQPGIGPRMAYNIPFYYRKGWICYLSPTKDGQVELGFTRGCALSDEQGLLDARGRKQVSSVIFSSLEEIPEEMLLEVLQEAILLDQVKAPL